MFKPRLVIAVVLLSGCNSFNTTTVDYHQLPIATDNIKVTESKGVVTVREAVAVRSTDACPVYQLPPLGPIPTLPVAQLKKYAADKNDRDYDRVMHQHIEDLRLYAKRNKLAIESSYADYIRRCSAYRKSKK